MMQQRTSTSRHPARYVCAVIMAALAVTAGGARAEASPLPLDDFSPMFLGMYRKVMEIEDEIRRHAAHYGVDVDLARAVCLYESGGNSGLASHAGAQGYFQVMPRTYRELRVTTNIEAGVKYLAQMIQQFGREDRAVAAYNGGPGRIGRAGGLPLETLQYVVGVGHYRTVLKQYEESIRHHASLLQLATVREGEDWAALATRLGIQAWELRLHNPFLAGRRLRAGERIAYPPEPRPGLLTPTARGAEYRVRIGDNYIKLAVTLGLDIEALRAENALWQLQSVPPGLVLQVPLTIDRASVIRAALGTTIPGPLTSPSLDRASTETESSDLAAALAVASEPAPAAGAASTPSTAARPSPVAAAATTRSATTTITHRVRRGETLTSIAQRYGTTVSAIQRTNNLRRTAIQAGQVLRIVRSRSPEA